MGAFAVHKRRRRSGLGLIAASVVFSLAAKATAAASVAPPAPVFATIASRNSVPGNLAAGLSNGTDTYGNSRLSFFNESEQLVGRMMVLVAGWTTTGTTTSGEEDGPNDITTAMAIEYPAGTVHQLKYNAAATALVNKAGHVALVTDAAVNMLPGAQGWCRSNVSVTAGQKWCNGYTVVAANGDTCETGTGANVDKSMSGTISGTTGPCFGPAVIMGEVAYAPPVVLTIWGDSWPSGQGDGAGYDDRGYLGGFAKACRGRVPMLWMCKGGASFGAQANTYPRRLALMQAAKVTHTEATYIINDGAIPRSRATFNGYKASAKSQLAAIGSKLITMTCPPRTDVTVAPANTAPFISQDATTTFFDLSPAVSTRSQLNSDTRALLNEDDFLEVGDLMEPSRDNGLWIAGRYVDGTHTNTAGHVDINTVQTAKITALKGTPRPPTLIVTALAPAPAISGTAQVTSTLTCSTGVWSFTPTSFSFQWKRNGSSISGATSQTYTLQAADEGATITCQVTAANANPVNGVTTTPVGVGPVAAAPTYETESTTLFAAMSPAPSTGRKTQIDAVIKALKASLDGNGVSAWSKLDIVECYAAHSEDAASFNWKSGTKIVTVEGAPAYAVDRGWTCVPANSQAIHTGHIPNAAGQNFALNDAFFMSWVRATGTVNSTWMGIPASNSHRISFQRNNPSGTGGLTLVLNASNVTAVASPNAGPRASCHAANRTTSASVDYYLNGSFVSNTASTSVAVQSAEVYLNRSGTTAVYTDDSQFLYLAGKSMTAQQIADIHAAFSTYKTALGA